MTDLTDNPEFTQVIKDGIIVVDKLTAGRELDALVAEKVMGWVVYEERDPAICGLYGQFFDVDSDDPLVLLWMTPDGNNKGPVRNWKPSEDISAAWKVVEKMKYFGMTDFGTGKFDNGKSKVVVHFGGDCDVAETVPLAICKAALKAVMNV